MVNSEIPIWWCYSCFPFCNNFQQYHVYFIAPDIFWQKQAISIHVFHFLILLICFFCRVSRWDCLLVHLSVVKFCTNPLHCWNITNFQAFEHRRQVVQSKFKKKHSQKWLPTCLVHIIVSHWCRLGQDMP